MPLEHQRRARRTGGRTAASRSASPPSTGSSRRSRGPPRAPRRRRSAGARSRAAAGRSRRRAAGAHVRREADERHRRQRQQRHQPPARGRRRRTAPPAASRVALARLGPATAPMMPPASTSEIAFSLECGRGQFRPGKPVQRGIGAVVAGDHRGGHQQPEIPSHRRRTRTAPPTQRHHQSPSWNEPLRPSAPAFRPPARSTARRPPRSP